MNLTRRDAFSLGLLGTIALSVTCVKISDTKNPGFMPLATPPSAPAEGNIFMSIFAATDGPVPPTVCRKEARGTAKKIERIEAERREADI